MCQPMDHALAPIDAVNAFQPLIGEPVALDLVNTRPLSNEGPKDLIGSLDGLRAWLKLQEGRLVGFCDHDAQMLEPSDLKRIWRVRDVVTSLVERLRHDREPLPDDVEALNAILRKAPLVRRLVIDAGNVSAVEEWIGSTGDRLAACLAYAGLDLIMDPSCRGIRQCAADNCVMLFMPTHPQRRWCSPTRCGNRERVARHFRRRKPA